MDKATLINKIREIGQCEDSANRLELLTQLQEAASADYDRIETLEAQNTSLTSDNEDLRAANMKLFLRIGDHQTPPDDDKGKEKREFKNLFDEKGRIK